MPESKTIRIGGASAFWGDSVLGPTQLVQRGDVQYLVFDYLAELTMSILARARRKDASLGYATDFIVDAMRATLVDVLRRRIRVVANAGGMNPTGCAVALTRLADELGVRVRIGVVEGDDLMGREAALREMGVREMATGASLPTSLASVNAYFGAFPIARALDRGADIVVTGRCVDSALALGPLIHEFGWGDRDYDRLAAGSLVGHLLECGTQATGGIHTDWRSVPDWSDLGYPVAECAPDGSFVLTKPPGTGGVVNRLTAAEQMIYEIGDPASYLLPDVTADFTGVTMTQLGQDRVRIEGARGRAPTDTLKVSATHHDGWRGVATLTIVGRDAVAKAERTAAELLRRVDRMLQSRGMAAPTASCVEVLGSEKPSFGPNARGAAAREVVLRIAVQHPESRAIDVFAREIAPFGTAGAPGSTGFSGRSKPQPVLRLFSFLLPKRELAASVSVDGETQSIAFPAAEPAATATAPASSAPAAPVHGSGAAGPALLCEIAVGRSGDKGDLCNVGLIARDPAAFVRLWAEVTPEWVAHRVGHLARGPIERHALPGIGALNFVIHGALAGGGMASLRNDSLGKTFAQILLEGRLDGAP
jgi:hypothetical protein